jgi:hypothetical protein
LSKYTELFQLFCWGVFFVLWPPARKQLRRPGPYLALLVNLACALPVFIWNWEHDWITVTHVAGVAGLGSAWKPTLRYLGEFLAAEAGLLNPIFFVATVWAAVVFWRRGRHDPRLIYFFSMGAPLFLAYLIHSFRSRVLPNWVAPSVLPLFCLMVIYWDTRWRLGAARIKPWLIAGLALGLTAVVLCHNTDLLPKLTGWRLPVNLDPLHRVRGWGDAARMIGEAREKLLEEGKPVFIIGDHYSLKPGRLRRATRWSSTALTPGPSTNSTSGPATRIAKAKTPSSSASWIGTSPSQIQSRSKSNSSSIP